MPRIKSAKKRMRIEAERHERNRAVRSQVKTVLRTAERNIFGTAKKPTDPQEATRRALSTLDVAAKKGVIHKNTAARKKSRLMRKFNAKVAAPA